MKTSGLMCQGFLPYPILEEHWERKLPEIWKELKKVSRCFYSNTKVMRLVTSWETSSNKHNLNLTRNTHSHISRKRWPANRSNSISFPSRDARRRKGCRAFARKLTQPAGSTRQQACMNAHMHHYLVNGYQLYRIYHPKMSQIAPTVIPCCLVQPSADPHRNVPGKQLQEPLRSCNWWGDMDDGGVNGDFSLGKHVMNQFQPVG